MKAKIVVMILVLIAGVGAAGLWFIQTYQDVPVRGTFPADPGPLNLDSPESKETLPKRFDIDGQAYSAWADEGKLPIDITSAGGTLLWEGYATMPDWMTDATVPFRAHADVGRFSGPAVITVRRSNQTNDPSYDKEVQVPVVIGDDIADDKYTYDPGQIAAYSVAPGGTVSRPLFLQGSASTRWFDSKGRIAATVVASDGETVLWSGYATTSDDVTQLHIADFSLSADVGTYLGDITISFKAANPDGDSRYDATYLIDLSVQ